MTNLEIINSIKKLIKNKEEISQDVFDEAMDIFCDNVLKISRISLQSNVQKSKYEYFLNKCILIKWYQNTDYPAALKMLCDEIEERNFEWGILFHCKGIWLLNRDIKTYDLYFKSKKTTLKFLFSSKTDLEYLGLLHKNYLTGYDKSIYFFRDMISYKNSVFPSNKSNSWNAYWSCNKRFFYFYIKYKKGKYLDKKSECYGKIGLKDYEEFIRKQRTIKTPNSAKNQFFYIKSFILSQADNEYFNMGSKEIVERCKDILYKKNDVLVKNEPKKIAGIIKNMETQRNGLRNKTIFLLLICFGMERRRICGLEWSDINKNFSKIRIGEHNIAMPHILQDSFRELYEVKKDDAKYVFGNSRTQWKRQLPENSINGILECIADINPKDEYYKNFSPANIRRWLFGYLMGKNIPLQDVMKMMDISISNLGNYINDDKLWKHTTDKFDKGNKYLLEKFMDEVEQCKDENS